MRVAAVIPTVTGRERSLARAVLSVAAEADAIVTVKDYATCGGAWDAGIRAALALDWDYLLVFADDLEALPGWSKAAAVLPEKLPGAILLTPQEKRDPRSDDGPPGALAQFPRVPLVTREQAFALLPFPDLHYYSDCLIGDWLARPTVVDERFRVIHHWSGEGRHLDDTADHRLYLRERGRGRLAFP